MLPPHQAQQAQQQAASEALLFTKQPFKPPEVPRKMCVAALAALCGGPGLAALCWC
jgi:hypothetical protein